MASSEAGRWLQDSLLNLCSDPLSGLQLEPEVVSSLVSYCELAPPSDAKEYLSNIVGDEYCKDIVTEYLLRRGGTGPIKNGDDVQGGVMQAYVKPRTDETWSVGSKKTPKNSKSKALASEGKVSSTSTDTLNNYGLPGAGSKGKGGGSKVKKGGKGITLAEAAEGRMLISRGAPCNCQASRHKLVNNCLACGKIVCEQEGEGPCNFCGALVLREGSKYAGLEGTTMPSSEAEASAQAFKDRLVEYGRTSSQRTTVIDDQSDYFQIDGNAWLSEEEKQLLQRRQQELELAEEARKNKVVVTIDLLGRKVVMAGDSNTDLNIKTSILGGNNLDEERRSARIRPNPYVMENPVFVDVRQAKDTGFGKLGSASNRRHASLHNGKKFARSGRVQHDDPLVEALGSQTLKEVRHNSSDGSWQRPEIKQRTSQFLPEDEECLMDCRVDKSRAGLSTSVLDICGPEMDSTIRRDKLLALSPSTLVQKQAERKQLLKSGVESVRILMPGMVLLKHWLNASDQVEIVKKCRVLGVGPGGFYQPGYGNGNKMQLWMMCLGKHWEPTTNSYELKRSSYDNAMPPEIPPSFITLVDNCLNMAQHAFQEETRRWSTKGKMDLLPAMHPDVCLVNFYEHGGRLGLHQDRDESQESLQNGAPVVSFSVGDSADFLYGMDRNVDMAQKVTLDSGDVLVFGGPSRMIFHGILDVHPRTAPSWLVDETNLRPGRLNLTFRQL